MKTKLYEIIANPETTARVKTLELICLISSEMTKANIRANDTTEKQLGGLNLIVEFNKTIDNEND